MRTPEMSRNVIPGGPGGAEPEIKVSAGWAPLRPLPGVCTRPSSPCILSRWSLWVLSCKDTGQMAPGRAPKTSRSFLSSVKPFSPKQPHSQGPGTQASTHEFGGGGT